MSRLTPAEIGVKGHLLLAGRWDEDGIVVPADDKLHLGMAVDTDDGLVVPVIRNVCQLTLDEIARQSQRLVVLARLVRSRHERT